MRRSFTSLTFVSVLASGALGLAACGSAAAPPRPQPCAETVCPASDAPDAPARFDRAAAIAPRTGEPMRDEVYLLLMANADVPLRAGEHCDSFGSPDATRPATLGDFYATLLGALEEQPISLPIECALDGQRFACDVNFLAGSDGESPWHCGVRFEMDKDTRRPVPESLMCIGTC